ncbi:hypothetical protein [Nonomuraea lactucae]|uniref:hypothetical protein n=1 Tax=Nonomuraea lactucae TaxID=2249762 RepID=UPI000DE5077C|nr:hypothetical protein [Nonomuraea lactucae]
MPDTRPIREDLQATLDARRDLGPDYETALLESFAARLDAVIAARVQAGLHGHDPAPRRRKGGGSGMVPLALGSLALGIPLTAVASVNAGRLGLMITWLAIVAVNVAAAAAIIRRD